MSEPEVAWAKEIISIILDISSKQKTTTIQRTSEVFKNENNGSVEVPSVKVLEDRLKRPKHYRRGRTVYITGNSSSS